MNRLAFAAALLVLAGPALADILDGGTWVQRPQKGSTASALTMRIEGSGATRKITYLFTGPDGQVDPKMRMTVDVTFDGKDCPLLVNGQPSGQTMAVRKLDARHTSGVMKMNGKQYGISSAELSPDGKVLTIEDEVSADVVGQPLGKVVHYWDRK